MLLDYLLWVYIKVNVYTDEPASKDILEDNIEAFIREVPTEKLERLCQNWTKRVDHLRPSRDQYLHEIFFKPKIVFGHYNQNCNEDYEFFGHNPTIKWGLCTFWKRI